MIKGNKEILPVRNLSVFNLTIEEKELFYLVVNKLSRKIYRRRETISSRFLDAIEKGDEESAFKYAQELSWKKPAIKILHKVKSVCKQKESPDYKEQLDKLYEYVNKYDVENCQSDIIRCSECGGVMTTLDMTCPSCGKLVDE